ncbi:putative Cys-rich domain containing protein [Trichomonas vaginalis G3]|uniref:Uncharacterized Cys-rich domain containing protein n=1 Tax=Trichomonas vaginalis (strain ATCC PRA-98 / G3) TaxID=412133 RepID=A2ET82_TRIV3|nr:uncharacterized protein TVAGG3_0189830 [Trichomonas vaginalis G3]EAY04135.1 putative Cys-rich domain containing protein [Trichomonas vaginalis G3]KAI5549888.1 PLAC8 family [Trichomonas vaginalis G3]|eukprot:XP_001316358.1 hypothetical protein [Trichomonas vaginalis G3]
MESDSQEGVYKYDLFSCFEDIPLCLFAVFCPPCAAASNKEALSGGGCWCPSIGFIPEIYWTRQIVKTRKHMVRDEVGDCVLTIFCLPCVLVQDGREIKSGSCPQNPSEYYLNTFDQVPLMQESRNKKYLA